MRIGIASDCGGTESLLKEMPGRPTVISMPADSQHAQTRHEGDPKQDTAPSGKPFVWLFLRRQSDLQSKQDPDTEKINGNSDEPRRGPRILAPRCDSAP